MDFEKSSIERLKRTLYSRDENLVPKEKRTPVSERESNVPEDWGTKTSFDISPEIMVQRNNSFFNKFLIGSVVFFLVALGIALFIFFGGINMISSNNLDIKIVAPSSISSGESLSIGLTVANSNRTDLENANLFIEYPDGAQSADGKGKTLNRDEIPLGNIPAGGSKDYSINALLFGQKDAVKEFTFRLEYQVKGSNATFSKEKKYDLLIGSSPVLLNVTYPSEVNSGGQLTLAIEVTSNSSVVVKNSIIKVDYPYGFTYKDSSQKPLRNNSIWNIGDLKNGDKKTLTITGILIGQDQEDRTFQISVGSKSSDPSKDFDTTLATSALTIGIRKSFFNLTVTSSDNNVTRVGQTVPVTINWQNTLPDKILNSQITVTLKGDVLDRSSVTVSNGGFYKSVDNAVLWDKNNSSNLGTILPGDSGQVSFSLASLPKPDQVRSIKNPHIDLHVVMTGDRSGTDTQTISSSDDITIKLSSTVSLTAKSYRSVGPFTNTGPIPPRADKESTYTVTWTLTDTTNDLSSTVVTATLPPGVEWKGETSPSSERISYNPDTKVVTWNIGNVTSGTGFTFSPREISFKVGIIPSVSQVGSNGALTSPINLESVDMYTTLHVSQTLQSVTTEYSDPSFKLGNGAVVK